MYMYLPGILPTPTHLYNVIKWYVEPFLNINKCLDGLTTLLLRY